MKKSGKGKSPSNIAPGSLQAHVNSIRRKKQGEGSGSSTGHFQVPQPVSTYVPPDATLHIHSDTPTDQEETPCNTGGANTEVETETGPETEPEVPTAMRRRGRNKNIALNKQTSGGEKIRILFNRDTGIPFSGEAKMWSRHIGLLVTQDNILPHCTESWRKLAPATLDALWQGVIDKFDAEDIHLYRDATLRQMRARWEDWRHRMNKDFVRPFENDIPSMREHGPPNMDNAN